MAIEWDGKRPQEILEEELEKARVAIIHKFPFFTNWPCWRVMRMSGSIIRIAAMRPKHTKILGESNRN